MGKLICAKDIEKLVKQGETKLYIEAGAILTPSAKDAVKSANVEVCEGQPVPCETTCEATCDTEAVCEEKSPEKEETCEAPSGEGEITSEMIYKALKSVLNI